MGRASRSQPACCRPALSCAPNDSNLARRVSPVHARARSPGLRPRQPRPQRTGLRGHRVPGMHARSDRACPTDPKLGLGTVMTPSRRVRLRNRVPIADYAEFLRGVALRVTRPRAAVLGAVHEHPHADTDYIIRAAREELPDVSHQTVYDALTVLTAAGAECGDRVRRRQSVLPPWRALGGLGGPPGRRDHVVGVGLLVGLRDGVAVRRRRGNESCSAAVRGGSFSPLRPGHFGRTSTSVVYHVVWEQYQGGRK